MTGSRAAITPHAGGAVLQAAGIIKRFSGVVALDGMDIRLESGSVTGLLGPNGSGKTTLVNCLSGVLVPDEGTISFAGERIERIPRDGRARRGLIRTFQNLRLFPSLSVAENVECGLFAAGHAPGGQTKVERVAEALDVHGLMPFARRAVGTLAYGLQKRTEIARALIARPRILLLDEPAAGLGAEDWQSLAEALRKARDQLGFGMLLIDHNVAFVRALAERLIVMANGKLIRDGAPSEVLGDGEVARIYLGDSFAQH